MTFLGMNEDTLLLYLPMAGCVIFSMLVVIFVFIAEANNQELKYYIFVPAFIMLAAGCMSIPAGRVAINAIKDENI